MVILALKSCGWVLEFLIKYICLQLCNLDVMLSTVYYWHYKSHVQIIVLNIWRQFLE